MSALSNRRAVRQRRMTHQSNGRRRLVKIRCCLRRNDSTNLLDFVRIAKIKRPIMWLALVITGLAAMILNTMEMNLDIPRISPMEGNVYGTVRDIEYKKDKIYLYLKKI